MKVYNCIVVNNKDPDLEGKIKVYIPTLMPNMEMNSDTSSIKTSTGNYSNDISQGIKANQVPNSFKLENTITAVTFNMNSNSKDGSYLVPDEGSLLSVFFMNEDMSQCYYIYNSAADLDSKVYVLDLASLLEGEEATLDNTNSPTSKPNIKVLLRTKNNSIIAIDTNDNKNSVMVKTNGTHFIELQDNDDFTGVHIKTNNGNMIEIDDDISDITINTKENYEIWLSEDEERLEINTEKNFIHIDDKNELIKVQNGNANSITLDDKSGTLDIINDSRKINMKSSNIDIDNGSGSTISMNGGDVDINNGFGSTISMNGGAVDINNGFGSTISMNVDTVNINNGKVIINTLGVSLG